MATKHDWFDLKYWAEELEKKYPKTNLLALKNKDLVQMLLSLKKAEGMTHLPKNSAYFHALVCAWVVVQHGGVDDSHDVPDAWI